MQKNLFHNKFYFMPLHVSGTFAHHQEVKIAASGFITPIGVMKPEAVQCNFDLLMMSTCARNM